MKEEIVRRQSLADALAELFTTRPGEWIALSELAKVGGTGGFRTRISELRLKRGMHIEHNGKNGAASCHRFLPYTPLARDASTYVDITAPKPLFPDAHLGAYQR